MGVFCGDVREICRVTAVPHCVVFLWDIRSSYAHWSALIRYDPCAEYPFTLIFCEKYPCLMISNVRDLPDRLLSGHNSCHLLSILPHALLKWKHEYCVTNYTEICPRISNWLYDTTGWLMAWCRIGDQTMGCTNVGTAVKVIRHHMMAPRLKRFSITRLTDLDCKFTLIGLHPSQKQRIQ